MSIKAVVCKSWLSCVNRGCRVSIVAVVCQSWMSCVNRGCRVSIVAFVCQSEYFDASVPYWSVCGKGINSFQYLIKLYNNLKT